MQRKQPPAPLQHTCSNEPTRKVYAKRLLQRLRGCLACIFSACPVLAHTAAAIRGAPWEQITKCGPQAFQGGYQRAAPVFATFLTWNVKGLLNHLPEGFPVAKAPAYSIFCARCSSTNPWVRTYLRAF